MTTESVAPAPSTTADIPAIVQRLRATFAFGRTRSIDWRKDQLRKLERLMVENEPAVAAALAQDLGRKPFVAWLADVASTVGEAAHAAKNVGKWTRRKYRMLEFSQLPGRQESGDRRGRRRHRRGRQADRLDQADQLRPGLHRPGRPSQPDPT